VHDDLVTRVFTAPRPDQLWLTDITEHPAGQGTLYPCAIKDACSNRIVGYSMDARMTADLAVTALRNAVALRAGWPPGRGSAGASAGRRRPAHGAV
jgi:transposase InsO family protein